MRFCHDSTDQLLKKTTMPQRLHDVLFCAANAGESARN
jgi:hypothetical protein